MRNLASNHAVYDSVTALQMASIFCLVTDKLFTKIANQKLIKSY
jgi:hypothetical protein